MNKLQNCLHYTDVCQASKKEKDSKMLCIRVVKKNIILLSFECKWIIILCKT